MTSNVGTVAPWKAMAGAVSRSISEAMPELIVLPGVKEFSARFAEELAAKKWLSINGDNETTRDTAAKAVTVFAQGIFKAAVEMPIREGHAIREKIAQTLKAVGFTVVLMDPSFFKA
jgi:PP-loop superfamily ATP-utilizing enzyme